MKITVLEDYKKSIISEGVTRGLDCNSALKDSGIFYMGPIKETWSISKIGYICTKLSRGFLPEDTALVCSNKGKVLIRDENAVGKMVSEDNAMQGMAVFSEKIEMEEAGFFLPVKNAVNGEGLLYTCHLYTVCD